MGSSGSKNEEERKPQINIIKDDNKEKDINNKENENVIPGSTNDWEQIMIAKEDGVLPAEILSGKLQVETLFLVQGKLLYILSSNSNKIFLFKLSLSIISIIAISSFSFAYIRLESSIFIIFSLLSLKTNFISFPIFKSSFPNT